MLPIRDTIPSKNYPIVNNAIIGINVFLFLVEMSYGKYAFINIYGLIPARFSTAFPLSHNLLTLFSFMFIHGGFWHLLGNMWSLYIFGDNIEDRLGHLRYLAFYLLCGLASGLIHLKFNLSSTVPTVGASGAIAGVMGAYFILYPRARILTVIPIFIIPFFFELPAFFFLGFWFVLQLINASATSANVAGIAWWAHIGGFVTGMLFLQVFLTIPATNISSRVQRMTKKKKSPRLQVIRPVSFENDPHTYGIISITQFEGLIGTRKLVNIPMGFSKRMYNVIIPPGTADGNKLRLKGLGKQMGNGQTGDLILKVSIE